MSYKVKQKTGINTFKELGNLVSDEEKSKIVENESNITKLQNEKANNIELHDLRYFLHNYYDWEKLRHYITGKSNSGDDSLGFDILNLGGSVVLDKAVNVVIDHYNSIPVQRELIPGRDYTITSNKGRLGTATYEKITFDNNTGAIIITVDAPSGYSIDKIVYIDRAEKYYGPIEYNGVSYDKYSAFVCRNYNDNDVVPTASDSPIEIYTIRQLLGTSGGLLADYVKTEDLAPVAKSNSYNDLDDLPEIPEGSVVYQTFGQFTDGAISQKVVTDKVNEIDSKLEDLENNKVEKVNGKQLSTNDYTTIEKEKLLELGNPNLLYNNDLKIYKPNQSVPDGWVVSDNTTISLPGNVSFPSTGGSISQNIKTSGGYDYYSVVGKTLTLSIDGYYSNPSESTILDEDKLYLQIPGLTLFSFDNRVKIDGNGTYSVVVNIPSDFSKNTLTCRLLKNSGTSNVRYHINYIKLEEGNQATPNLQTTIGLRYAELGHLRDSSGDIIYHDEIVTQDKLPSTLPNPNKLIINKGISQYNYDGSSQITITIPETASEVSALPNTTRYAASIYVSYDSIYHKCRFQLYDQLGASIGASQEIDLPLESMVIGGYFDEETKEVVLQLRSYDTTSNTIRFSVADLVRGLVPNTRKINGKELSQDINLTADDIENAATKQEGVYLVDGTGNTTAGTWSGTNNRITSYYDGLVVNFKIGVAGANPTTLNINGLGAKTCYLRGTTKVTTQYAVGTMVLFTYNATTDAFYSSDYDANSSVTQTLRESSSYNGNFPLLLRGTSAGTTTTTTSTSFGTKMTANPYTGELKATTFTENGTTLASKYLGISAKATSATTADTVNVTDTTPSSATMYYPLYTTGRTTGQTVRANQHLYYYDAGSWASLNLGAAGSKGILTVHTGASSDNYVDISPNTLTANRTLTIPDKSGTIATTSDIPTVDSALSSTSTNPVQNKVVTTELNSKVEYTETGEATMTANYLLELLFPVGSIRLSVNSTETNYLGGTWELVAQGRAIFGAGAVGNKTLTAGGTLEAGLPNITGQFDAAIRDGMSSVNLRDVSGAFSTRSPYSQQKGNDSTNINWTYGLSFNASLSNSIYGNNTTVCPPAYGVYVYRRIS